MAAKSGGKRAGARRGARPKRRLRPKILAYAVAITVLVIGWGYLVWLAIDFGGDARDGDSGSWTFAGLAALGAAACLFAGLMLATRLLRALGDVPTPEPHGTLIRTSDGDGGSARRPATLDASTVLGPGGYATHRHLAEPTNPYATPSDPQTQPERSNQAGQPAGDPPHPHDPGPHRHRAG